MAKVEKPIRISKAALAKLPRNEQRRYLDLGYVEDANADRGQGASADAGGTAKGDGKKHA